MLSNWWSSWYQQNEQHQQQQLEQESFRNIEQTVGEGDDDWVQIITPSIRQQKPVTMVTAIAESSNITTSTTSDLGNNIKGVSRQERRAKARFAVREMKKQARTVAMVSGRNMKGLASSTCLPASPLTA